MKGLSSKASNVGKWTTNLSLQTLTMVLMMPNPVAPIGIMEIMQKVYTFTYSLKYTLFFIA